MAHIWGDTSATVVSGRVDWFLSGGGFNDRRIDGNASVTVWGGTINAEMGGTYGVTSAVHTITGDATITVYGGDFSGCDAFAGGASNSGSILGDSTVTLDLRKQQYPEYPQQPFVPPAGGTYICGGRPYGAGTGIYLGTDTSNTITLNIFADADTEDVLNGAKIYGDGGTGAANTKSGSIAINIDAPGSKIGELYATRYSNISSTTILRNVTVNIKNAKSITKLSGGSSTDNFTNTIYNNSVAKGTASVFNVGPGDIEEAIAIDSMINFTELNIDGKLLLAAGGDGVKNGRSATAENHGATYNLFGNINLGNGGGVGITNTSAIISGGVLNVNGACRLVAPPGKNKVNITDYSADTDSYLEWTKTSGGSAIDNTSIGTWFGANPAYQALTFSPTAANAKNVTPFNFRGIEEGTGKTFLGDNDPRTTGYGYGIAIPGSIIDFSVEEGRGAISHDMDDVSIPPIAESSLPIKILGTVAKNTLVQRGQLMVPAGNGLPTLTFRPEWDETQSWIKDLKVTRSDKSVVLSMPEQLDSAAKTWTSADGQYSYNAGVKYTDKAEVSAVSIILKESEAAAIEGADGLVAYNKAEGRPFFASDITEELLNAVQAPLGEELMRIHPVTYMAGKKGTDNYQETTVNVVVVRDGAELADDRSFAIFAQDAVIDLEGANLITSQEELDQNHTLATVILCEGTTEAATISAGALEAITGATDAAEMPVIYTHTIEEKTISKSIVVYITTTVPLLFEKVDAKDQQIALEGAEFSLYTCDSQEEGHTHSEVVTDAVLAAATCWQPLQRENAAVRAVSGEAGIVDLGGLENGTYMLVEIKAPEGYETPVGQWEIVANNKAAQPLVITAKGSKLPPAFSIAADGSLLLPNMKLFVMPTSGAGGIYPYITIGIAFMAGAGILLAIKAKKRKNLPKIRTGVRNNL